MRYETTVSPKTFSIIATAAVAATLYISYKLVKHEIEEAEKEEIRKNELAKFIREELAKKNYKEMIKNASLYNENLDAHQRTIANDILTEFYEAVRKADDYDEFDMCLEEFNEMYEIFSSKDKEAILSIIDRRIQIEESRKIEAQRKHELAMAKAAGENEIEIAKISANAEKAKAHLYSNGIRNAAQIITEVTNERKQES